MRRQAAFKIIVIYFVQGRFIQECDFRFSLENDTGRPKKRCLYCYMHQFLELFDLILVCRPATATILSISAQGSEGRHFMNRFVLASVTGN